MRIIQSERFTQELNTISDFIAEDSLARAQEFQEQLKAKIEAMADSPLMYRKSNSFNDDNIRDLIFKGYVIPYLINNDEILILGIYKANKWEVQ